MSSLRLVLSASALLAVAACESSTTSPATTASAANATSPADMASSGATSESAQAEDQSTRRDCFLASSVTGFSDASRTSVNVSTGPNTLFQLETFGTCNDLNWTENIGLRPTGGSPWICIGQTADLVVPSSIGRQRCSVRAVRRLTQQEARAEREAARQQP